MIPQREQIEREDLVTFINACFAATGQAEFYGSAGEQRVSIDFLHAYIAANYRLLYARCLAAGINQFNRALVVFNLLRLGAPKNPIERREEGALIRATLQDLPPPRVYRLFRRLRLERVNNRRARAVVREYLSARPKLAFDAVKYRSKLCAVARHIHLRLPEELGDFLFLGADSRKAWNTSLLESFRQAKYSAAAAFDLPATVAEGLSAQRGMDRKKFLERAEDQLTAGERLRLVCSAMEAGAKLDPLDLGLQPLTRLAIYLLSLPLEERQAELQRYEEALARSAQRVARRLGRRPGRVAAVLDRSYSAVGSREKKNRPLAVALATSALLRSIYAEYRPFWTTPIEHETLVTPFGQTRLAAPLLEALAWRPELVVVVSDGFENDPPGGAAELVRVYRQRLDPQGFTSIVLLNPVFDSSTYMPRALGPSVPTVGLRDAEDALTMIGFARFVDGSMPLHELERYLRGRSEALLAQDEEAA